MNRVLVILAAYNGEKWIQEQVDSILKQTGVSLDILCSVDLSTDSTFEILDSYGSDKVKVLPYGERYGGAGPNFYRLFRDASFQEYDYVALADQDDIWLDDKVISAIYEMELSSSEALSSDVTAFWADGKEKTIVKSSPQTSYDHFFESPGPGCSFVLSHDLALGLQVFIKSKCESELIDLHDWLIYAFARSFGYKWTISNKSKLLYRQHDNNQCGANSGIKGIGKRFKIMRKGWYSSQVIRLFKLFDPESLLLERIERRSHVDRLYLFLKSSRFRRKNREKIMLSVAILLRLF
ncbi:glycosyltransferase [Vibrio splendidus]|uniref:glycosyltransferase n=1 Tax=Vibrio splendidus TaxID=29497 RepID=UPI000066F310|nr:glycosyltransferase [Vibrio splendidus]EAP95089.1 glycosyltransferase, family 2 [Vibrio splendidus 12B01]